MIDLSQLLDRLLRPPSPAEGEEALRDLLREVLEADVRGDHEASYALHIEITFTWLLERIKRHQDPLSPLELVLLDSLGMALTRRELFDRAEAAFRGARTLAERHEDRFGEAWFELRLGHLSLDRRAPESCEEHLHRAFGRPLWGQHAEMIDAAFTSDWSAPGPRERHEIRLEALRLLGRVWASQGRLISAGHALSGALEMEERHPSRFSSGALLALELAEVRLDRGDFQAVELLRRTWERPWTRYRWDLLQADVLSLKGRLSEAQQLLASVAEAALGALDADRLKVRHSALWQRAQILANLNRMDEARGAAEALTYDRVVEPATLEQLWRHLVARRAGAPEDGLPAVQTLLRTSLPLRPAASLGPSLDSPSLPGWCERAREWWGKLYQLVLIDLDLGHVELAHDRLQRAAPLAQILESSLLRAQYDLNRALVALVAGDTSTALSRSAKAAETLASLEQAPAEWSARRLMTLALARERDQASSQGSPWDGEPRLAEARRREEELLLELRNKLSPADRALYLLNKQSSIDQAAAAVMRELRDDLDAGRGEPILTACEAMSRLVEWGWSHEAREVARSTPNHDPALGNDDLYTRTMRQLQLRRPRPSDRLDATGLPTEAALLWYVSLPDRLEALLFQRDGVRLLRLPPGSDRGALRTAAGRWLRLLEESVEPWAECEALPAGRKLAHMLGLDQVLATLPEATRTLYLVPDDVIFNLPFAALTLDGRPLVERLVPIVLPVFHWSSPRFDDERRDQLGIAVPSSAAAPELPELPGTLLDLRALDTLSPLKLLRGPEATRRRVIGAMSRARGVHFACHGCFPHDRPHEAGLLLDDGWLTLSELIDLNMPARVVSAACWTGGFGLLPGRELIGLPATLLDLGAEVVISPLWGVDDRANPALMADLYRAIRTLEPAAALAEAQRRWIDEGPTTVWAAYVAHASGVPRGMGPLKDGEQ
jgi:hypothetical protein